MEKVCIKMNVQKGHLESRLAAAADLILTWTEERDGFCCLFWHFSCGSPQQAVILTVLQANK